MDRFARDYRYGDDKRRIRYLIFSETQDKRFMDKGVTYITYASIINYVVSIRGQSWTGARIGVASHHQQWSDLIKNVFRIANDQSKDLEQKITQVTALLAL